MGKIDKLKSRLNFTTGVGEDDYLHKGQDSKGEVVERDDYSGEQAARDAYAGLGITGSTPTVSGRSSSEKLYSQDSPFASGASPAAVKKHIRKPDLKRASQISGSELRDVEENHRRYEHQVRMDARGGSSFKPRDYSEASLIANHLKEGKTVTIDLSVVPTSQRQRFIDFMAGLVYALDGHLVRSAAHVYILTPK